MYHKKKTENKYLISMGRNMFKLLIIPWKKGKFTTQE